MNRTLSTILIVVVVLALAGGLFFAGSLIARTYAFGPGMMFGSARNNNGSYGPGVMNGRGAYGRGPGFMGGGRGYGMMGGYGWINSANSNVTPPTVEQAKQAARKYIQSLNIQGLEIGEVMIFNNNAYVAVKETATGFGAFELLVDPVSQVAYPEYGPNMMWNVKYGALSHGSMMGGYGGMMGQWYYQNGQPTNVSTDMPVTKDQAIKNAQAYLDQYQPGTAAANDPTQFYGYYTLDFSKDGTVAGMLSVNGYSGQIFLHTWHGTFVEEAQ